MPVLNAIWIYPIKSLDGVSVSDARVLPSGALEGDREFAIVDGAGQFVNGKRTPRVHQLRARFNLAERSNRTIAVGEEGTGETCEFELDRDRSPLEGWLSNFFGQPVRLQHHPEAGFPDDTNYPGPTAISSATLTAVADWFEGLDATQMQQRLRANLEIGDVAAFWEDRLCANGDLGVSFRVGESVTLAGTNPCARCIVPTRDPQTGVKYRQFQRTFAERRQATFPEWGNRDMFDHYYRLAVNTKLVGLGANGRICVGDRVHIPN